MKIVSSYDVKLTTENYRIFDKTADITTKAVKYFLSVYEKEWYNMNYVLDTVTAQTAMRFIETLTHKTKSNQSPKYDFDSRFYKMPSGIRRYCINKAFGMISSYTSNLENWNKDKTGKRPSFPKVKREFPCFYKSERDVIDTYHLRLKVYNGSDWVWILVKLNKSDVDYLSRLNLKLSSPIMEKRYKRYYLRYAVAENVSLNNTDIKNQRILSVDLGINNAATCSVMLADGTVLGREFLKLTREKDHMQHILNKMKKAQKKGAVKNKKAWARAKGINNDIAIKTAKFIIETAMKHSVDVIVFEHLNLKGRKRGRKKRQLLHLWKTVSVQRIVEHKAHQNKIRISRINPYKTSRLAYDGSGDVERGEFIVRGEKKYNYSICVFRNGKQYNCDLNASYNIGARYFIRELLKTLPEMARLAVLAKVPEMTKRSRCTLSSLISFYAVL